MRAATNSTIFGFALLGLPILLLSACPASFDERCEGAACANGDAGGDGGFGTIYVSPRGDDGAPGTQDRPLRSLTAASAKNPSRVNVCEGEYAEPVKITGRMELVGGFDCGNWAAAAKPTRIVPSDGISLTITANGPVLVSDVEVTSANSTTPGASSIAAFVSNSGNVTFRRVKLTAGNAASAISATAGSNFTEATAAPGEPPVGEDGGSAGAVTCKDGTKSAGGKGGDGVTTAERAGKNGTSDPPAQTTPGERDGAGGTGGTTGCGTGALPGADGAPKPAAKGAERSGRLTESGWQGQAGGNGGNGDPGQGGGGGGGKSSGTASGGGGGGSGGCGGAGGPGGAAGGSSFALLSFRSNVTLVECILHAGNGGNGADGAQGGKGQNGGAPKATTACIGAAGGNGAGGGGGGGGAGGLSVGVGYVDNAPIMNGSTTEQGTGGAFGKGGPKGDPGSNEFGPGKAGNSGLDGKTGESAATKELPQ